MIVVVALDGGRWFYAVIMEEAVGQCGWRLIREKRKKSTTQEKNGGRRGKTSAEALTLAP